MRLEDLNWMDVEAYLAGNDRIMLVLGACEQHGYLSLLTDVKIPMALALAASQRAHVPIAPPLNFGVSPYFSKYPGTLSLRLETFLAVVGDLVRALYAQGFRRLLVLNGHGGNSPASTLLSELVNELPGLQVSWYAWWVSPAVRAVAEAAGLQPDHANWLEAFPFCRVADLPEGGKAPFTANRLLNAGEVRALAGDGVYGGPYTAPEAVMQQLLEVCVEEVVARLRFD